MKTKQRTLWSDEEVPAEDLLAALSARALPAMMEGQSSESSLKAYLSLLVGASLVVRILSLRSSLLNLGLLPHIGQSLVKSGGNCTSFY